MNIVKRVEFLGTDFTRAVGASPCDKREELALQICFGQIQCQIGLVSVFGFSKWSKEESVARIETIKSARG